MKKSISSFINSDRLSPGAKGVLLVVGAYFATIWAAILIIALALIILMGVSSCSTMGRALVVLWITIALLFLASLILVKGLAWKITPSTAGRLAILAAQGLSLLVSYVIIAFVLLVAFNC